MNQLARLILLAALVGVPLAPAAGQADLERTVVIGVRTDARPFAWQAEDNPETYRGFLVDICFIHPATPMFAGIRDDPAPEDINGHRRTSEDTRQTVNCDQSHVWPDCTGIRDTVSG
jgi:hypothetical protein